jgi:tRNA threonylcarbamoyladenosine biosynthesis protein TsaE
MEQFFAENISELKTVASQLINHMGDDRIILFNGHMGAGKTTLIKAICETMRVIEPVNSPTFSIVNEYSTPDGTIIYHFDCYRIKNVREALEMGAEEYLYSGNYCFIEWAEKIASLLPDSVVEINITEIENGVRKIELIRN